MAPTAHYEDCKQRAQSPDDYVRIALAQDEGTPPEILYFLAMDPSPRVRSAVALNPRTPHLARALNQGESHDIVSHGNAYEIKKLVENPHADIAPEDMDLILIHAPNHTEWHEALVNRPNLTLEMVKKIALFVCHALLKVLLERHKIDDATAQELVESFRQQIHNGALEKAFADIVKSSCYPQEAETGDDRARRDYVAGTLTEERLSQALASDPAYAMAALALHSGLDLDMVHKAVSLRNPRALVAICWKAGFSPRLALQVQQHLGKIHHGKLLYPKHGTEFPLSIEEMLWQLDMFTGLC